MAIRNQTVQALILDPITRKGKITLYFNQNKIMNPGIYIHIPFCKSKCGYCDFYSLTDLSLISGFLNSLHTEIEYYAEKFQPKELFDTIYIGGGTPSILSPKDISDILNVIFSNFKFTDDVEITFEINPGTVNRVKLYDLKLIGINRISIGIQSFINRELNFLGRIHSATDALNCYTMVENTGFENISIDLIYALPNQNLQDWQFNLKQAIELNPDHISAYNLTIEKDTPFYNLLESGKIILHTEEKENQFFNMSHDLLSQAGYIHYEISNFSKTENKFSRHNFKYWQHIPYLGFGPAAHSFWDNHRWGNIKSLNEYISKLDKQEKPIEFLEKLSVKDITFEHIFLCLRTYHGINLKNFKKKFLFNFVHKFDKIIKRLQESNLAVLDDHTFRLTHKGMLICDEIFPAFMEA